MNKVSKTKKRVLFLIIMGLIGALFSLIYLSVFGNTDQKYDDIIAEYTAIISGNKSVEMNLLFLLIFVGIIVYFIFYVVTKKRWSDSEIIGNIDEVNDSEQKSKEFLTVLIAMASVSLVVFNGTYQIVIAALLYAIMLYVIDKELIYTGICTFYLIVYTFIGIYRLYTFWGGEDSINTIMIAACALFVSIIPLCFKNKRKKMIRFGMLGEIFIPLVLLVYLSNKYKYGDATVIIDIPRRTNIFVLVIILGFVLEAVYISIKKWNSIEKIDDIITFGSCVAVMTFNRFEGTGAIMSTDLHHPFENIIGFSQVFKLGQTPFRNYIPVSGMYSIFQGAIFDVFGEGGTFANYYLTNNLFYLLVIILVIALMMKQVDRSYVFILSLIFYVQSYNRLVFMLPIMLLLICPKLIERKNAWLMTWFLTSLFQGLYYSLYGVATCIAFLPLGIWQVVTFVKSGELKKSIKSVKFWICWVICATVLLLCSGYLVGTLKHILAMSGQSVLAYGIPRFGQSVPIWFFPYLGNTQLAMAIRIACWYIFTFMIPVGFVWIAFAVTLKSADISFLGKRIKVGNVKTACIMLSAVIMPIICYTFTFIRLDIDNIYARGAGVLLTAMVLMLVFAWNYFDNRKLKILLTFIMITIPTFANTVGIFEIESNSKLDAFYTVPEGYIYVDNDAVEKLGTGFIEQGVYESIEATHIKFDNKDKSLSYMGDPSLFGYFYLLDIKGDGAMELADTVKSLSAAEETIDIARSNKSIIAPSFFAPYYNYYLYHWLLTSGEYVWDAEMGNFIPNDGMYTKEETMKQNKNINTSWDGLDCGKIASSWGMSMESLAKVFTNLEIEYSTRTEGNHVKVEFKEAFDGNMADFIYLQFAEMETDYEYTLFDLGGETTQEKSLLGKCLMKRNYNPNMTVQIGWQDDNRDVHTMQCKMSKGKLLIPIGAGQRWLLNQHDYISISVYQDGNETEMPTISNMQFLKIREAN